MLDIIATNQPQYWSEGKGIESTASLSDHILIYASSNFYTTSKQACSWKMIRFFRRYTPQYYCDLLAQANFMMVVGVFTEPEDQLNAFC